MCFYRDASRCANMAMFAIDSAEPFLMTLADGYMGLGLDFGFGGKPSNTRNILDQMIENSVIQKKMFGLYTKMSNDTEARSQIRFGGYNDVLFEKSELGKYAHEIVWIPTVNEKSWMIEAPVID